jgi:hypothetical protein
MPRSRRRRQPGHGEVVPPLSVSDRIDSLLKEHLSIFPSKPELSEAEIEHWHRDLNDFRMEAIEYAFDNWRRNGRFFPVYADIIELCEQWEPTEGKKSSCSAECKARHWKGYGWPDIHKLSKLFMAKRGELKRPLTENEFEMLLDAVDQSRGKPPVWREIPF